MSHRHPECAIASGMQRDPLIGIFRNLTKIWGKYDGLGAVITGFGKKVGIRGSSHIQICAHYRNKFGVIPIGAFAYIRLLPPYFRRGIGQVAIPVVEAQVDAAEQLQETAAGSITQHGHGWNGRETDHPIRTIFFGGVNICRSHYFQYFIPGSSAESAFAACLLILFSSMRIVL